MRPEPRSSSRKCSSPPPQHKATMRMARSVSMAAYTFLHKTTTNETIPENRNSRWWQSASVLGRSLGDYLPYQNLYSDSYTNLELWQFLRHSNSFFQNRPPSALHVSPLKHPIPFVNTQLPHTKLLSTFIVPNAHTKLKPSKKLSPQTNSDLTRCYSIVEHLKMRRIVNRRKGRDLRVLNPLEGGSNGRFDESVSSSSVRACVAQCYRHSPQRRSEC